MSWTEEHVEALRGYLSEAGVSFAQATASLNDQFGTEYSRNAIIGKCGREKIISRNNLRILAKPRKPRPSRKRRPHRERHSPPALMIETAPLRTAPVEPRNLTLVDLGPEDCRWPVSGPPFLFCGCAVFSGSYCGAHDLLSKRHRE